METRKVLQAARPPVGEGPPVRVVLAGLRRLRPPVAVLVAVALMAVVPLVLLGAAVGVVVRTWSTDGVLLALVKTVLVGGTLFLLAALSWRGVKRALHVGSYREGLFVARLVTIGCLFVGGFLLWYVMVEGNPQEPSMLVPFAALAVVWLPAVPLQARSAREWPDRVALRRGPQVRSRRELAMLLTARPHVCRMPLPVELAVEVVDEEGRGWVWQGPCPHCGVPVLEVFGLRDADASDPGQPWAWGRPGSPPALGGGDLVFLADAFGERARLDPALRSVPELVSDRDTLLASVQATEQLLQLVPEGRSSVPPWRRTGRPVPLVSDVRAFDVEVLRARVTERQAALAAVQAELTRRAGSA